MQNQRSIQAVRNVPMLYDAASIKYPQQWESSMIEVQIMKLVSSGREDKKVPLSFDVRIIASNEVINIISWHYDLLTIINSSIKNNQIVIMYIDSGYFNRADKSIRCTGIQPTNKISNINNTAVNTVVQEQPKQPKQQPQQMVNVADIKSKINKIIDLYVKDPDYRKLLHTMLGDKFYNHPAARTIHHAYAGGEAVHAYTTTYIGLQLIKIYESRCKIDTDLAVTGFLLHDIGKLDEYTPSGELTMVGNMLSHIALGLQMITEACIFNNIDPNSLKIKKLSHLIASHHGELEFGSTNTPVLIEAHILSIADRADSTLEQVVCKLNDMKPGEVTPKIWSLGSKLIKC